MGGIYATELLEITNDPRKIDDGFWAVTSTFDGKFTAAKFGKIEEKSWQSPYTPLTKIDWNSSHNKKDYCDLVSNFRKEIAAGNVYQVNACRVLELESQESIKGLVAGFLDKNPSKYVGYLAIPGLEIATASPERFIERNGKSIMSSPIKGTRPAGECGAFPEKDNAENVMIVDLMRNDFGRVCIEDSIHVPNLLQIKELPGLTHLVSDVVGTLKSGITWAEIFEATLPPGSVSGAPKISAIDLIKKYEKVDRGPYCGVIGWIQGQRAELAVAIRTFWSDGSKINFGTGAGITWASDPESEWEETELKAKRLISIANGELFENLNGQWASGEGLFETTRVEDGMVFAAERHYLRALNAASKLGFPILEQSEVLARTAKIIADERFDIGRLRWQFGNDGNFNISYTEYKDSSGPAKLTVCKKKNLDFNERVKTFPYENLNLLKELQLSGFDDGILVAPDGQLTETTVTSILFKREGEWVTPPLDAGILLGVVRAIVLERGIAREAAISIDELPNVESAILLSSLRIAQPVSSIDSFNLLIDQEKCNEISRYMAGFKGK